jgi:hypothetical protein
MGGPRQSSTRWIAPFALAACATARGPVDEPKGPTESPDLAPTRTSNQPITAGTSTDAIEAGVTLARATEPDRLAPGSPALSDVPIADEPMYFPGTRPRGKGSAVETSRDDEMVATWNHGGYAGATARGARPAHPAPRVKVDVTDVRGDASGADMQRAARLKSYWPFRICYEQGLRRMQKLHGTIKLRLTIGPSGRPSGVQQLASELKDPAVVSCVVQSAMALGLPAPASGAPQITLDVSLWPGDEPVSVTTSIRGKNNAPDDAPALVQTFRARDADVKACYAAGLRRHEGLWGRLALELRLASGKIDEVSEVESHFPDPEVTECVRKIFLHMTVLSTAAELVVVYPLRLGRPPESRDVRH